MGRNLGSSFFFSLIPYKDVEIMCIKKWHQLAEEKSAVDQQTRGIRQRFRAHRINKEFGQVLGEELFKLVTRRLDKESTESTSQETRHETPY